MGNKEIASVTNGRPGGCPFSFWRDNTREEDASMDWDTVAKTVGISGILIGVIGYLIRSLFKQILSIDMAKHQHELEIETERFRSQLGITAFEHQTRFSVLHVKRAEVIAELYKHLYYSERDASLLISIFEPAGIPPQKERYETAYGSCRGLSEYFEPNRICFSLCICEKVTNITKELFKALVEFRQVIHTVEGEYQKVDIWMVVWEKLSRDIHTLKLEIENEFREILDIPTIN
jgi:hypothetical protein